MTADDLAFVADALLSLCERNKQEPHYTEDAFHLKLQLAQRREPNFAHVLRRSNEDPLLQRECREIVRKAKLTARQNDVLIKRMEGWTFEEIGLDAGHSKQAAQNIFLQALRKLVRCYGVYPYKGLSEVYRQEVHRGVGGRHSGKLPT